MNPVDMAERQHLGQQPLPKAHPAEPTLRVHAQMPPLKPGAKPPVNGFLQGPFAPVDREVDVSGLRVRGELPKSLDGLYARIGPNPMQPPRRPERHHWFVGDGMVHAIDLQGGQALSYRNRWVGSDAVQDGLGRPRLPGPRNRMAGAVNTNVMAHAGQLWAMVEAGSLPIAMDEQLQSLRHGLFASQGKGQGFSAHPHLDAHTGELHALCYDAMAHRQLTHVCIDAQGGLRSATPIAVRHGPMVHDCALTRGHVVVLDLPVTFSWRRLLRGDSLPYGWNPRHPARVGLLARDCAQHGRQAAPVRWYELDPCFAFHTCNAHEREDGAVVMDLVVFDAMFVDTRIGPELQSQRSRLERWVLPAKGSSVQRQVLSDIHQEFPRYDERLSMQANRYAYAVQADLDQAGGAILKHDLQTGQVQRHVCASTSTPGEFVFVPRHADSAEDDGWLMGLVHNHLTGLGEMHVIHAQALGEPAQAIVELPVRVPLGFHGNWVPRQDLHGH